MACFSRVQNTTMTSQTRLVEALTALGWAVTTNQKLTVVATNSGVAVTFGRGREDLPFNTSADTFLKNTVQRQYSAIGVRAFAKKNRFSIAGVENDGLKFTLKARN